MDNKVMNQLNMREMNLNEVLKIIRDQGPLTRRKLQEVTGLSWGGVSQIVTRLLNQNLIIEEKDMTKTTGRRPTCLQINSQQNFILGVDINSSGITAVIQNLKNEILEQLTGEADCSGREKLLESVWKLTDKLYDKYRDNTILAVGISMQSAVEEEKGISLYLKECPDWKNVPLCEIFTERYDIASYLAHDPDCLVASNVSLFGEDVILFRIDYGIGMSVYKNGDFIKAPGMLEIGNTLVQMNDREIQTLNETVTIEAVKNRINRKQRETVRESEKSDPQGTVKNEFEKTVKTEVLKETAQYLALSIANASLLFDIPTILLSGKLIEQEPTIYTELEKNLREYLSEETKIFKYDEKRAAAGAAWIAAERFLM